MEFGADGMDQALLVLCIVPVGGLLLYFLLLAATLLDIWPFYWLGALAGGILLSMACFWILPAAFEISNYYLCVIGLFLGVVFWAFVDKKARRLMLLLLYHGITAFAMGFHFERICQAGGIGFYLFLAVCVLAVAFFQFGGNLTGFVLFALGFGVAIFLGLLYGGQAGENGALGAFFGGGLLYASCALILPEDGPLAEQIRRRDTVAAKAFALAGFLLGVILLL